MLKPLTSLRFAAAFLVFLWHCPVTQGYAHTFSTGYAGVSFFFLLSGFILVYTYHDKFDGFLSMRNACAFYQARFARVYPLLFVSIPVMLAVLVLFGGAYWDSAGTTTRLAAIAAQVTLLQSWIPVQNVHFGVNGPAWSISDEAFFYAMFPLAAFFLLRCLKKTSTTSVLLVAVGIWVLLTALLSTRAAGMDDWLFYVFPPTRFVDFFEGMIIGIAFIKTVESRKVSRNGSVLEAAVLLGLALAVMYSPSLPQSLRFSAAFMPFFGAIIYVFARQGGGISRFISNPIFVKLGEMSFAFYMIHLGVILAFGSLVGWAWPAWDFLAALAVSTGLAYVLYTYLERPLRERIRNQFLRSERSTNIASPLLQPVQSA